jgi:cytochrome P450
LEDVEVHGVRICAGEGVVTSTLAAGWDPSAVEDPATFRLDRSIDASLPFGLGRRACPARGVVHAALTLALETFFTGVPRAHLISDPGESITPDSICPSDVWVRT